MNLASLLKRSSQATEGIQVQVRLTSLAGRAGGLAPACGFASCGWLAGHLAGLQAGQLASGRAGWPAEEAASQRALQGLNGGERGGSGECFRGTWRDCAASITLIGGAGQHPILNGRQGRSAPSDQTLSAFV